MIRVPAGRWGPTAYGPVSTLPTRPTYLRATVDGAPTIHGAHAVTVLNRRRGYLSRRAMTMRAASATEPAIDG